MTKSLNNQKIPSEQLEEYLHRLERKVQQLTLAYRETKVLFQKEINQHQQTEAALQKANQELQRLATTDGYTQVANRRRFDEYLSLEWRRLTRSQAPLSLILCDVDFFKSYNDTYGHLAIVSHPFREMLPILGSPQFSKMKTERAKSWLKFSARKRQILSYMNKL